MKIVIIRDHSRIFQALCEFIVLNEILVAEIIDANACKIFEFIFHALLPKLNIVFSFDLLIFACNCNATAITLFLCQQKFIHNINEALIESCVNYSWDCIEICIAYGGKVTSNEPIYVVQKYIDDHASTTEVNSNGKRSELCKARFILQLLNISRVSEL